MKVTLTVSEALALEPLAAEALHLAADFDEKNKRFANMVRRHPGDLIWSAPESRDAESAYLHLLGARSRWIGEFGRLRGVSETAGRSAFVALVVNTTKLREKWRGGLGQVWDQA